VDEVLTDVEVARHLRVSLATVRRWRAEGTGPPWFRAGRAIRYSRRALNEWIERQERDRERRD
jgi:excisionase family DNA binding protein